jgi:hypothetical protein
MAAVTASICSTATISKTIARVRNGLFAGNCGNERSVGGCQYNLSNPDEVPCPFSFDKEIDSVVGSWCAYGLKAEEIRVGLGQDQIVLWVMSR